MKKLIFNVSLSDSTDFEQKQFPDFARYTSKGIAMSAISPKFTSSETFFGKHRSFSAMGAFCEVMQAKLYIKDFEFI